MPTTFRSVMFVFWTSVTISDMVFGDQLMYQLYHDLLSDYEADIRPSESYNITLHVTFGFSLAQIIDVDEKNQILTTNAWINQMWVDHKIRWNPEDYDNITTIHIPYQKIWRPDIVLYNNADSNYNTAIVSTDVFVTWDGNVTWLSGAIFKSSCPMNVRFYPFDEQICHLKFASWAYDGNYVDLIYSEKEEDTNYMTSTEWELTFIGARKNVSHYSCCPDEPYPDVTITIQIKRKPMFYVFNLILPCILITGIALLGFYMPSDSGEKVTLGITTLLSMTVFLMLVAESMPPTSESLPLIGMYYGVTICLVSLATAMTVFTLNVHHKGLRGSPVPRYIKIVAFKYLARLLCIQLDPPDYIGDEEYPPFYNSDDMEPLTSTTVPGTTVTSFSNGGLSPQTGIRLRNTSTTNYIINIPKVPPKIDDFETQFLRVLQKLYTTIEKNEIRLVEQDRKDAIKMEWQQVALVADRFLLIVFVTATTLVSLFIMYQRELLYG